MFKRVLVPMLVLLSLSAFPAEQIDEVDADFLDYLADMEGEGDDWTLLADAEDQAKAARTPPPASDSTKASKEAAPPAVDER